MAIAIVYPASLPGPRVGTLQAAERRALGPAGGPLDARVLERDRRKTQQIELPPFTDAEAAIFRAWFDDDLVLGGAWFSSTWPMPAALVDAGYAAAVRRWIGQPTWSKDDAGFWHVAGPCEVRGRGMPPFRQPAMVLGLHFDNDDFIDESGHSVSGVDPGPGYSEPITDATDSVFGGASWKTGDLWWPLVSDNRGGYTFNALGEWEISCWIKIASGGFHAHTGGTILELIGWGHPEATGYGGGAPGVLPSVYACQFQLSVVDGVPNFTYVFHNVATDIYSANVLNEVVHGANPMVPADDEWHHLGVVGDATSTRMYLDFELIKDDGSADPASPRPPGTRPMWAGQTYQDQRFLIGSTFAGTFGDYADFPSGIALSLSFNDHMDDLAVWEGPGSATFIGPSFDPITAPFANP